MRRLVRPVAFLLSFVLIQLVLVESGYACRAPADGSGQGSAMAGMRMPDGGEHSPSAPGDEHQQKSPCQFPWAPGGCQAMASCAPSALTVASTATLSYPPERPAPVQLALLAPPALTSAPELPPPRA